MTEDDRSERQEPRLSRPRMPAGYGVPQEIDSQAPISWEHARGQLAGARSYWICTADLSGRPHVMPVWGLWLDEALFFSTGRTSRKGRNLAANPRLAIHLESGDDVVILEGVVEEVDDAATLARFVDAYDAKYGVRPDTSEPVDVTYMVRPRLAFTWLEQDFLETAARWNFDGG